MNQNTTTQNPNALARLIGHCRERHPHFESPRGEQDISAAIAERQALIDALKQMVSTLWQHFEYHHGEDDDRGGEAANRALEQARAALALAQGTDGTEGK